jgi:hypothetical protein
MPSRASASSSAVQAPRPAASDVSASSARPRRRRRPARSPSTDPKPFPPGVLGGVEKLAVPAQRCVAVPATGDVCLERRRVEIETLRAQRGRFLSDVEHVTEHALELKERLPQRGARVLLGPLTPHERGELVARYRARGASRKIGEEGEELSLTAGDIAPHRVDETQGAEGDQPKGCHAAVNSALTPRVDARFTREGEPPLSEDRIARGCATRRTRQEEASRTYGLHSMGNRGAPA